MGQNRKTYSESFKKKVALESLESGKIVQQVAAENNVSPGMVTKWKQALLNGGFSKELKKTQKELEETNKKLKEAMIALGAAANLYQ